ncbi:MAG TPA: hypothetical protein VLI04_22225 [Nocardioidaceae bacterium]|nr:hypothetical protein [Nocardioidaceae bacterium]
MSRAQATNPIRRQGIPRVKLIGKAFSTDDASDAMFLASVYMLIPDPWQSEILNAWLSRRRDGKLTHRRCGLAVPRQNGKNGVLEVRELFGLIVLGEAILHTAHEIKTSRKAFLRLKHFFGEKADDPDAKFPDLNALVASVRNTNGQEAIFLKDRWLVDGVEVRSVGRPKGRYVEHIARGGFIEFSTRTGGGGRGTTYDVLVIDEAQHLSEEDLQAVRPVISSGPRGDSQIIYLGTPPDPDKIDEKGGEAWVRIRSGAGAKDLAWIEYGAPDGPLPDIHDEDLLYECNPSLGVMHGDGSHGLDFETIEGERADLTPAGLARERFGWWGNPEARSHRGVIDMDQWRNLLDPGDDLPTRGLIVVDCSPDLEWTTIAVATDGPDGRPLGLVDRHEGTGWVIKTDDVRGVVTASGTLVDLVANLDEVLEVALTPSAKVFAAALTTADIEHKVLTNSDVGAACTAYQRMIREGETRHVGQPELDQSAKQAITRYVGDTQQWDRRDKRIDISPLVAISVAVHRWALEIAKPPPPPPPPPETLPDIGGRGDDEDNIQSIGF